MRPGGTFGAYTRFTATLASPGAKATAWSATVSLPAATYGLSVCATDSSGRVEATDAWVVFTVA